VTRERRLFERRGDQFSLEFFVLLLKMLHFLVGVKMGCAILTFFGELPVYGIGGCFALAEIGNGGGLVRWNNARGQLARISISPLCLGWCILYLWLFYNFHGLFVALLELH
jgi:hypothetical protein